MNIFTRLGLWWDKPNVHQRLDTHLKTLEAIIMRIEYLEAEKQVPSTTSKEMNMLKIRLDRIELLVGLKREPVITNLPDAARIS